MLRKPCWPVRAPFGRVLFGITFAIATAASCSNSDQKGRGSVDPAADIDPTGEAPHAPDSPTRAEFGLDARPPNGTCLAPARPPAASAVKLEPALTHVAIDQNMMMAQPPGDRTRWFAAQRMGRIVSFSATGPSAETTVAADLPSLTGRPVSTDLEGGLLGLAFHPNFQENEQLFVSFTTTGPIGYASEIGVLTSSNGGTSFTSYRKVLSFDRPTLYHNAGGIAFGKDGYLYASFGDGAKDNNGQITTNLFGTVIRIDVDHPEGGLAYGIPSSNPFRSGGGAPEIFAWGFRNPFRLSIDRATGEVWLGDVGLDQYEEVNRVELGGNYGWPCRDGMHDRKIHEPAKCPVTTGFVEPLVEHEHVPMNTRAIVGGIVYRGSAIPGFQGTYVYGDFEQQELWGLSFDADTGAPHTVRLNETGTNLQFTGFAEDQDGEIYATSVATRRIMKLVSAESVGPPPAPFPDRLSKTGCVDATDPKRPAPGLVPYAVNAELWSDGADKERFLALPDGTTMRAGPDGDLELPVGSVVMKTFTVAGKLVETRLLVRHDDGEWAGYSYEWNDDESDAVLLPSAKTKPVADRSWTFPSRSDCVRCHTSAAGRTLGLEIGQLNGEALYRSTNRLSNQLKTLEHVGMLALPGPASALAAYPAPHGDAPTSDRARAYLHANCSHCHRPQGGAGRSTMDLRFATRLAETKTCDAPFQVTDLGVADARVVAPGAPERSLVSLRAHALDSKRMPPLGTRIVDERGTNLLDEWIRSLQCP